MDAPRRRPSGMIKGGKFSGQTIIGASLDMMPIMNSAEFSVVFLEQEGVDVVSCADIQDARLSEVLPTLRQVDITLPEFHLTGDGGKFPPDPSPQACELGSPWDDCSAVPVGRGEHSGVDLGCVHGR